MTDFDSPGIRELALHMRELQAAFSLEEVAVTKTLSPGAWVTLRLTGERPLLIIEDAHGHSAVITPDLLER